MQIIYCFSAQNHSATNMNIFKCNGLQPRNKIYIYDPKSIFENISSIGLFKAAILLLCFLFGIA